jgi:hypothetical protein
VAVKVLIVIVVQKKVLLLQDIVRLQGKHSSAFPDDLEYAGPDSVVFRDNLALIASGLHLNDLNQYQDRLIDS